MANKSKTPSKNSRTSKPAAEAKPAAPEARPVKSGQRPEAKPALLAKIRDNVARNVLTAFDIDQEFIKGEWRPVAAGYEAAARAHPDLDVMDGGA